MMPTVMNENVIDINGGLVGLSRLRSDLCRSREELTRSKEEVKEDDMSSAIRMGAMLTLDGVIKMLDSMMDGNVDYEVARARLLV